MYTRRRIPRHRWGRIGLFLAPGVLFLPLAHAQERTAEMADLFRSEGKIYVVIAVILTLFAGFLGYLYYTDRRLSALEKKLRNQTAQEDNTEQA